MVENKFKLHITDSKEYLFENKKFYLQEDIHKGLNHNIDMFSGVLSKQIQSNLVNIRNINSSPVNGREVEGSRLFHKENIENYVNDLLSRIKI